MKGVLTILFFWTVSHFGFGQYSNYYGVYDINQNINQNVNLSGDVNIRKNINTIDYGQLAKANAQREQTKLEEQIYISQREKEIALEVSKDPLKAYDYGQVYSFEVKGKPAKQGNFKKLKVQYVIPSSNLFVSAGAGRFENISDNNITTEIIFSLPYYNMDGQEIDVEKFAKMEVMKVGELNDDGANNQIFVHKKDVSRATVFGVKGFIGTLIWEDAYSYTITDNYASYDNAKGNGIYYGVKVRTYGDIDEVSFEELEGRRYYLERLIKKWISTAKTWGEKF